MNFIKVLVVLVIIYILYKYYDKNIGSGATQTKIENTNLQSRIDYYSLKWRDEGRVYCNGLNSSKVNSCYTFMNSYSNTVNWAKIVDDIDNKNDLTYWKQIAVWKNFS